MLDIKPYRNDNLACGEMVFATYLEWKRIPHELMFEHSWGREFLYTDIPIAETSLKKYYNIDLQWNDISMESLVKDTRILEIDKPLALAIDLKDADWIESVYTKAFPIHCIMAIGKSGIDDFICLDPTFSDGIIKFSSRNKRARYAIMEVTQCKNNDQNFIIEELYNNARLLSTSMLFSEIRNYGKYLSENLLSNEMRMNYAELLANANLYRLNRIHKDLLNYASMLNYISVITNLDLKMFVPKLGERAKHWELIRNAVTKYYCTGNKGIVAEIGNGVMMAAEKEESLSKELLEYLNKNLGN
jgi:hypothetical protein